MTDLDLDAIERAVLTGTQGPWTKDAITALCAEVRRLRDVLGSARAEVDRWGYGDFHYGPTARDEGVLRTLALIDSALSDIESEDELLHVGYQWVDDREDSVSGGLLPLDTPLVGDSRCVPVYRKVQAHPDTEGGA